MKEAVSRASNAERDQRKELDEMLSSLGVAPVSGKELFIYLLLKTISL